MSDEIHEKTLEPPLSPEALQLRALLEQIVGWQKLTAKAVRDLAEGLRMSEQRKRDDHQQLVGLVISTLPNPRPAAPAPRKRRDSDNTDRFQLPGGNNLELTRRTQKRLVTIMLAALVFVVTHAANYFLLPHPEKPAVARAAGAPAARPDETTGATPRIPVPALAPPRAP